MVFEYEELREAVREDFERFYQWGFHGNQIYAAVLDEYQHGTFSETEWICLHIFLALNYAEKSLDNSDIIKELQRQITKETECEVKSALGNEYATYLADLNKIFK